LKLAFWIALNLLIPTIQDASLNFQNHQSSHVI
jgi:hypothetical protein